MNGEWTRQCWEGCNINQLAGLVSSQREESLSSILTSHSTPLFPSFHPSAEQALWAETVLNVAKVRHKERREGGMETGGKQWSVGKEGMKERRMKQVAALRECICVIYVSKDRYRDTEVWRSWPAMTSYSCWTVREGERDIEGTEKERARVRGMPMLGHTIQVMSYSVLLERDRDEGLFNRSCRRKREKREGRGKKAQHLTSTLPHLMGDLSGRDGEKKQRGGWRVRGRDAGGDKQGESYIWKVQRQLKQSTE